MYHRIHCSNLSPILELSVKFASQICHENTNKSLDGAYLADFGTDINFHDILPLVYHEIGCNDAIGNKKPY